MLGLGEGRGARSHFDLPARLECRRREEAHVSTVLAADGRVRIRDTQPRGRGLPALVQAIVLERAHPRLHGRTGGVGPHDAPARECHLSILARAPRERARLVQLVLRDDVVLQPLGEGHLAAAAQDLVQLVDREGTRGVEVPAIKQRVRLRHVYLEAQPRDAPVELGLRQLAVVVAVPLAEEVDDARRL